MTDTLDLTEFTDEDDASLSAVDVASFSDAVLYASDWTVETVVSQLEKGNIETNPRFQRRDAWSSKGKSRFIESIIIGVPIPQLVLAEKRNQRGKFIVLDGKQRLLSLLQFTGKAAGDKNAFALSGLEARTDLLRKRYKHLQERPELNDDLNAFLNHTIRTVVIRNWPSMDFLHLVFRRLNTGSVTLSAQELRQAVVPGPFSDYADDSAAASLQLRALLSRKGPDPRMRDVELLVRFLAFRNLLGAYTGRMKAFLDDACRTFNEEWVNRQAALEGDVRNFEAGVDVLIEIFGPDGVARKADSKSFNRAIFDTLIFYASDPAISDSMRRNAPAVRQAYTDTLSRDDFATAIESDTAGIPNTFARLQIWGESLRGALGGNFNLPTLVHNPDTDTHRIVFAGF